jgi:hypothetical protein
LVERVLAARAERIAEPLTHVCGNAGVELSHGVRDRLAVAESRVAIGLAGAKRGRVSVEQARVVLDERLERATGLDRDSSLWLRAEAATLRVEAAEMEERERPSVDEEPFAIAVKAARVQVPGRNVVRVVAEQPRGREQAWGVIDPFLVNEVAAARVHAAAVSQSLLPPVQKRRCFLTARHRDESEVVCPGHQHVHL